MLTVMNAESQARLYSREQTGPKLEVLGPKIERSEEVLTPLALQLLASLHRRFNARRLELLNARARRQALLDRKSTRLNSSHLVISYAVFCLKKKKHTKLV